MSDDWPDGWYSDVARRQPSEGGGAGAQDPQRAAPDSRPSGADAWAYEPAQAIPGRGRYLLARPAAAEVGVPAGRPEAAAAKEFFSDLGHDRTLPKDLITGSSIEGTA